MNCEIWVKGGTGVDKVYKDGMSLFHPSILNTYSRVANPADREQIPGIQERLRIPSVAGCRCRLFLNVCNSCFLPQQVVTLRNALGQTKYRCFFFLQYSEFEPVTLSP